MNDPVPPIRKYPKRAPGADNYNFQMETGHKNFIKPRAFIRIRDSNMCRGHIFQFDINHR